MGVAIPLRASPSAFVRSERAEKARSRSPLTVQAQRPRAPRAMARTSGIAELLSKYEATQRSTIENMGKQRQEPSESDGRMAAQRTAPEPRTMLQRMEDDVRDREAAKRLGIDRFRRQAASAPT